ncbi:afadin-like [Esox lucius]|uniref:afadin-like n=1 Tax=Esox lucius TaxID=8010 RepID=UPI001476966D|nr:afadin-like [Esox lucius]
MARWLLEICCCVWMDTALVGYSQERAASIMMHTGPVVTLQVAKQAATYHGLAALLDEPPSVENTELDGMALLAAACLNPRTKALILYDDLESSSGPTGSWGINHHGGDRRQKEYTLLKNRQLYRSNPNIINNTLDEGEPVDPFITTDNKITAASTSNLHGSDMNNREYLTLPAPKSQDKRTVAFDLPPQRPRVSFNLNGQVSNKRTLMRQALSQENLCTENDHPLLDTKHNAPKENQLWRYYSSFPMKPCVSTHNIHSNCTVRLSTKTSQSIHSTGSGYWKTPMSNSPSSTIQPIRIDMPVTQPAHSQPRAPMITFQHTPTLMGIKPNQSHEGKGQTHSLLGNPGSHPQLTSLLHHTTCPILSGVSTRKLQPPPTSAAQTQQQKALSTEQPAKYQLFPTLSKDTSLHRPQPGTTPAHQDQYFSMNKEQPSEGNNVLSPDPWKRDALEKQQKQLRLQVVGLLEREVCDLQSNTQLTPEDTERLRKLNLEWQFQKRLQEFQENGDDDEDRDTSTEGSVKGYDELGDNFQKKCLKEGQEENNVRCDEAPENLTFKERQRIFSPGSNTSKVKDL